MSKKVVVAFALAGISAILIIYKAETVYQHMETEAKWARAFGYGCSPWLLGLLVAGIREGWARLRKREHSFGRSLLWGTGVFATILVVAIALPAEQDTDVQSIRDDAMLLMGAATWVPGVAAYCHKYVEANPGILDAANAWNRRHDSDLRKVVATIKAVGGLSQEEKEQIDRLAMQALKSEIESQDDKNGYCSQIEAALIQGILDLDRRDDTAPALERIRAFQEN